MVSAAWIYSDLSVASEFCVNWLSLEQGTAGSVARVMGQALSWCQVALQELSHPVLASPAHPHPEISGSKAK